MHPGNASGRVEHCHNRGCQRATKDRRFMNHVMPKIVILLKVDGKPSKKPNREFLVVTIGNDNMTLWVVRAGKKGEQEQGVQSHSVITMGWNVLPDLTHVKEKSELEEIYLKVYGQEKKRRVANRVGQIFAFLTRIKKDDLIALPSKFQSSIIIGKVVGDYEYKKYENDILHTRKVKWLKTIPRSEFDKDILSSFGTLLTIAKVKKEYAEKRVLKLSGETGNDIPDTDGLDEEALDLEQISKDQIIKHLEENFHGHDLALLIDEILRVQGYVTKISPPGPDGGVDILAGSGPLGFDDPKICVQVKSSKSPVSVTVLRELEGTYRNFGADYGILVAWGGLTKFADQEIGRSFFSTKLWDQGKIVDEIFKHYEKFDDEIKAELPLKRIWTLVDEENSE